MKKEREIKTFLEECAEKSINKAKAKNIPVTCRCGETPGGTKHIGNFNDNMRSYFIYLTIKKKGYPARHIQTRDNLDPFRRLPDGFYNLKKKWIVASEKLKKDYNQYIGTPLYFIPDPLGCCENYSEHFRKIYEGECQEMGLKDTQYFSTYELYKSGNFNPYLKKIFEKINEARKIVLAVEETKNKEYVPVWVICEKCRKVTGRIKKINMKDETVDYECTGRNLTSKYRAVGCGNRGIVDWKNGNTKMDWEFEWPAQMLMFQTTIEPFGKEHFIGSWPLSKQVIEKVYEEELPLVFFYEYFLIEKKKMATRHGNVIPLSQLLQILEPEVIRFLYTKRPRMQRSLDIPNIFRLVDEFDRAEKIYFGIEKARSKKEEIRLKQSYELSMLGIIGKHEKRISYRTLAYVIQTNLGGKWEEAIEKLGGLNEKNKKRLALVSTWIKEYASDDFKINVLKRVPKIRLDEKQKNMLLDFAGFFEKTRTDEEIQKEIKKLTERHKVQKKVFFKLSYNLLFGKEYGPELSKFLMTLDRPFIIKRFKLLK